jgi:hypothetical protein
VRQTVSKEHYIDEDYRTVCVENQFEPSCSPSLKLRKKWLVKSCEIFG